MFDLSPCRLSSLTDLGHNAYTLRQCPQCAGAFAVCSVCGEGITVCPGCHHADVRRRILAGEVVFPENLRISAHTPPEGSDQAGAVGELAHEGEAAQLDAGGLAVYAEAVGQSHPPVLGDAPVDTPATPFVLLVLPVDLAGVQPVLQALAAVIAPQALNGQRNGHDAAAAGGQRLPRHLAKKCYLSDTACPSGHTYQNTGKVLRYQGNNQCVPCSGQRTPRRTAASTTATTEG